MAAKTKKRKGQFLTRGFGGRHIVRIPPNNLFERLVRK